MTVGVSLNHPQYNAMAPQWKIMTDTCTCEKIIHNLGEEYLPRLGGQTDPEYMAYVNRAGFVFFTKRTVEAFHGMVMRKDVHVDGFKSINVDGKGSTLNDYVDSLVKEYLKYGRCGTLIDMPKATGDKSLSVADEIENNVFPRALFYTHGNILDWGHKVINNIKVLSFVKLREIVDVSKNEFEHEFQSQYRVLDLVEVKGKHRYRQRLFDESENQIGGDIFPTKKKRHLTFIPFYIHGGDFVEFPPLLPIAEQNIHHYMLDADYKHGLHFVALPQPWVSGVSQADKPKSIGPSKIWAFEDYNVRCGMLEFTGAGLSRIEAAMNATIEVIVTLASRVIAPQKSSNDESALAASIRSNSETSMLSGIVDKLSKDMNNAIRTMVWWSGGNASKVSVEINKDFMPSNLSGSDVLSLVTAWIKGSVSYESLFWALKKGEIIKGDRTLDDELKAITAEQKKRASDDLEKAKKTAEIKGNSADEKNAEEGLPSINLDRRVS